MQKYVFYFNYQIISQKKCYQQVIFFTSFYANKGHNCHFSILCYLWLIQIVCGTRRLFYYNYSRRVTVSELAHSRKGIGHGLTV